MTVKINIIEAGIGNIGSIKRCLDFLNVSYNIVAHQNDFSDTKKIILPGVGSFDTFMNDLIKKNLKEKIINLVRQDGYQIFGICLGMQVLFNSSEEGIQKGLGLINGKIIKFNFNTIDYKIPHMGWNTLEVLRKNELIEKTNNKFYFANSFHAVCHNSDSIISNSFHGYNFPSIVGERNIFGVQFHPEKSYSQGFKLIKKFVDII